MHVAAVQVKKCSVVAAQIRLQTPHVHAKHTEPTKAVDSAKPIAREKIAKKNCRFIIVSFQE
jgi:hypothetical protein